MTNPKNKECAFNISCFFLSLLSWKSTFQKEHILLRKTVSVLLKVFLYEAVSCTVFCLLAESQREILRTSHHNYSGL